jgi:putative DNA primase/helicase
MMCRNMEEAAAAAGIMSLPAIPPSGRIVRFGEKGCKGVPHYGVNFGDAGVIGTFRGGQISVKWCSSGDTLTESQRKSLASQIALAKAKQEREQRERYAAGAREAVATWNSLSISGTSDYLTHKQVGAFGVRFGDGFIAIPLRQSVGGAIHSLQLIYDDHAIPAYMQKQGRNKTFIKDGRKAGCFHVIGSKALLDHRAAFLCEGYATGASVHMATDLPVFVAFDCGNLLPVLQRLRKLYPAFQFTIAADDDRWKPEHGNPGVEKALEAATCGVLTKEKPAAAGKHKVLLPRFHADSLIHQPTDFNDLHRLEGLEMVRLQLNGGQALCN